MYKSILRTDSVTRSKRMLLLLLGCLTVKSIKPEPKRRTIFDIIGIGFLEIIPINVSTSVVQVSANSEYSKI